MRKSTALSFFSRWRWRSTGGFWRNSKNICFFFKSFNCRNKKFIIFYFKMKYFIFVCVLISCIAAMCEQYTTKEACLSNCWCFWRSELWQHPDACFPISAAQQECNYKTGVVCSDNESTICYVGDYFILLFKVGIFLIGSAGTILLFLAVVVLILFVIGKMLGAFQEEMTRRHLEHWITYGSNVLAVIVWFFIICVVLKIVYVVLTMALDMIDMLYESKF
jgi:hypothetical protein